MASSRQLQAIFDLIPGQGQVTLIDYTRKDAAILRTKPQWVDQVVSIYEKSGYKVQSCKGKHTDWHYIKIDWVKPKKGIK